MRRQFAISLVLCVLAVFSYSCNNFKYKSREEFKSENIDDRKEAIIAVLKKNDISVTNKYPIIYIDYVLTKSDCIYTLEKEFPTPDYKEFVSKVIPILYYAYSPELYKHAPVQIKENSKNFLINHIPYRFHYGKEKYKEYAEEKIEEGSTYFFNFFSEENPGKQAEGSLDDDVWASIVLVRAWTSHYNYGDFRNLSATEQGDLLRLKFKFNVLENSKELTPEVKSYIELLRDRWISRSSIYFTKPPLLNLSDSTPMSMAFESIRRTVME
jgi:hypothetical protein